MSTPKGFSEVPEGFSPLKSPDFLTAADNLIYDPFQNLEKNERQFVSENFTDDEIEEIKAQRYYSQKLGELLNSEQTLGQIEIDYGIGTTPKEANEKNLSWWDERMLHLSSNLKRLKGKGLGIPQAIKTAADFQDEVDAWFWESVTGLPREKYKEQAEKLDELKGVSSTPVDWLFDPVGHSDRIIDAVEEVNPNFASDLEQKGREIVDMAFDDVKDLILEPEVTFEEAWQNGRWDIVGNRIGFAIEQNAFDYFVQIGLAVATRKPAISAGYMGVSSAAESYITLPEDSSLNRKVIEPILVGTINTATEKYLGTTKIIDKLIKQEIKEQTLKTITVNTIKGATAGTVSEGSATGLENLIQIGFGDDVGILDNVALSAIVGSIMDGSASFAGSGFRYTQGEVNRIANQKSSEEIQELIMSDPMVAEDSVAVNLASTMFSEKTAEATQAFNDYMDNKYESIIEQSLKQREEGTLTKEEIDAVRRGEFDSQLEQIAIDNNISIETARDIFIKAQTTPDVDIDTQVANVQKAISQITPDVKVIVHETQEDYVKASGKNQSGGVYDPATKTLHISKEMRNERTVAHEAFHAIFLRNITTNAQAQKLADDLYKRISRTTNKELKSKLDEHTAKYGENLQSEEALAELAGIIATNYEALTTEDRSAVRKLIDFIAKGLQNIGLNITTDKDVIDLMNTVAGKLATGDVITEADVELLQGSGKVVQDIDNTTIRESKFTAEDLKRFKTNENTKVRKIKTEILAGKLVSVTESDRMVGGKFGRNTFLGGIFYPIITGRVWASDSKTVANNIVNQLQKDPDGYYYLIPAIMSDTSHLSNRNMMKIIFQYFADAVESGEVDIDSVKNRTSEILNTKKTKKLPDGTRKVVMDLTKYKEGALSAIDTADSPKDAVNALLQYIFDNEFTFDERKEFVIKLLGKAKSQTKTNFYEAVGTVDTIGKVFADPELEDVNIREAVTVIRFKDEPKVVKTPKRGKFYHPSYEYHIEAGKIEVLFLDKVIDVTKAIPEFTTSEGKKYSAEAELAKAKEKGNSTRKALTNLFRTMRMSLFAAPLTTDTDALTSREQRINQEVNFRGTTYSLGAIRDLLFVDNEYTFTYKELQSIAKQLPELEGLGNLPKQDLQEELLDLLMEIEDGVSRRFQVVRSDKDKFTKPPKNILERVFKREIKDLLTGTIDSEYFRRLVRMRRPSFPFVNLPLLPTDKAIEQSLKGKQKEFVGDKFKNPKQEGDIVESRLDIPAYTDHGVFVVTIHEQRGERAGGASTPINYRATVRLKNVKMIAPPYEAAKIGVGERKSTVATVQGELVESTPEDDYVLASNLLNDPNWTQVGYNPVMFSYFYDRADMKPVVSGSEMVQIGGLLFVKDAVFADPNDKQFKILPDDPQKRKVAMRAVKTILGDEFGEFDLEARFQEIDPEIVRSTTQRIKEEMAKTPEQRKADAVESGTITGINRASVNKIREAQELARFSPPETKSQLEVINDVSQLGETEIIKKADALIVEIGKKPRPLSDNEVATLLIYLTSLDESKKQAQIKRNEILDTGNLEEAVIITQEINGYDEKINIAQTNIERARTELGRGLAALGMLSTQEKFDVDSVKNNARNATGRELTETENKTIEKGVKIVEKKQAAYDRKENKVTRLKKQLDRLRDQYDKEYRDVKKAKPIDTEEEAKLKQEIKLMRKRLRLYDDKASVEQDLKLLKEGKIDEMAIFKTKTVDVDPELEQERNELYQAKAKLRREIFKMRGWHYDFFGKSMDFFRALKLSFDMGYFGRQGMLRLLSNPVSAVKVFGQTFPSFLSDAKFLTIDSKLKRSANYKKAVSAGLGLLDLDVEFSRQMEGFSSRLAERIPWVRASNRHMITGLNLLRMSMFDDFVKKNPTATPEVLQTYAKFVNEYTGRGDLGKLENSAQTISKWFMAPRWVTSKWQTMISARRMWTTDAAGNRTFSPELAKSIAGEWARAYTSFIGLVGAFTLMGFEIELDPEDPDFMKLRLDNYVIDITGGRASELRLIFLAAEVALASRGIGDLERNQDLTKVLKNYASYKVSSAVSLPLEFITGENLVGDERTWFESVYKAFLPIIVETVQQDMKEGMEFNESVIRTMPEFFGIGSQSRDREVQGRAF